MRKSLAEKKKSPHRDRKAQGNFKRKGKGETTAFQEGRPFLALCKGGTTILCRPSVGVRYRKDVNTEQKKGRAETGLHRIKKQRMIRKKKGIPKREREGKTASFFSSEGNGRNRSKEKSASSGALKGASTTYR